MAATSLSGSWVSSLPNQVLSCVAKFSPTRVCTRGSIFSNTSLHKGQFGIFYPCYPQKKTPRIKGIHQNHTEDSCRRKFPVMRCTFSRRLVLAGVGTLAANIFKSFTFAEEVPENYRAFVDFIDGYSYYYPADWRDFDFRGHDSAFKDRALALQNVRVSFKPTDKQDIRDLGPMNEVIFNLVRNVLAAPNQRPTIFDMQEKTVDGKNYWTFEYELASPNFSRTAFATIAIGNGRYYTLIVGANERRWSRFRNRLKVVADSFKLLDI